MPCRQLYGLEEEVHSNRRDCVSTGHLDYNDGATWVKYNFGNLSTSLEFTTSLAILHRSIDSHPYYILLLFISKYSLYIYIYTERERDNKRATRKSYLARLTSVAVADNMSNRLPMEEDALMNMKSTIDQRHLLAAVADAPLFSTGLMSRSGSSLLPPWANGKPNFTFRLLLAFLRQNHNIKHKFKIKQLETFFNIVKCHFMMILMKTKQSLLQDGHLE